VFSKQSCYYVIGSQMGSGKRKPSVHMAAKRKSKSVQSKGRKNGSAQAKARTAAKKPADLATTSADLLDETAKAPTTFLLRLPGEMRKHLEKLKDESESKSLNALILQLLAEGLERKADFEKAELFARDLHVATLAHAVGSVPDPGNGRFRIEIDGRPDRLFQAELTGLLSVHQQVVQVLENQKLTSFASIMDPALLAYRLLLEFSLLAERHDIESVRRDFSNGLKDSALLAMKNRKWAFAEQLLKQAVAVDPTNVNVGYETGIYMLRRLMRRWCRPDESITPGVTNDSLISRDYEQQTFQNLPDAQRVPPEDVEVDNTTWAIALRAWDLLNDSANTPSLSDAALSDEDWSKRWNFDAASEKVDIWKRLATIILCTSSPNPDDLELMTNGNSTCHEEKLLGDLTRLFRTWASEFRMTREVSRLQERWADWLEPLEVLWWLGYRKEAYMLATEARGFIADKTVGERMASIRRWNPEDEMSESFGFDEIKDEPTNFQQVIWDVDEFGDYYLIADPPGLLNRPMSV